MCKMENIEISDFSIEDLPAIVNWRNDSDVNKYLRHGFRTLEEVQKWHREYFSSESNRLLAIYYKNKPIGYCTIEGIDHHNKKCEVAIVIGEKEHWHKGIGTMTIRKLTEMAFSKLHMHRIFAVINKGNSASVKCFSNAGFQYEGKLREAKYVNGRYRDLLLYSILDHEWKDDHK
jgi:RimJ/RimL family protein N-acetyltransferase